MITSISIENFKGIGERVTIPIRPITLLFGPNSAGKSSVMHAIHYAREVLERHNLDADKTVTGGECVNLGGFREMVHGHKPERQIKLRFDLDLSGIRWHERFPVQEFLYSPSGESEDLSTIGMDLMSGWIEISIGYEDPTDNSSLPVVLSYQVGLDGAEFATIEYDAQGNAAKGERGSAKLTRLNIFNPVISWYDADAGGAGPIDCLFPEFRNFLENSFFLGEAAEPPSSKLIEESRKSSEKTNKPEIISIINELDKFIPNTIRFKEKENEKLGITLKLWLGKLTTGQIAVHAACMPELSDVSPEMANLFLHSRYSEYLSPIDIPIRLDGLKDALPEQKGHIHVNFSRVEDIVGYELKTDFDPEAYLRAKAFLSQILTRLIVGPAEVLKELLDGFRYVGPIRQLPQPGDNPPRFPDPSRWASGLAAWDSLADLQNSSLVKEVSDWLWNASKLNTGYQLVAKRVREIEEEFQEQMLRLEWEEDSVSPEAKIVLSDLKQIPVFQRVYLRDVEKNVDLPATSVGIGISQIIPVIVALLADGASVIQVEQPELHLHPTQQAAVGDLIIERVSQHNHNSLLIETHSEHLILRILKRIRQSSKGLTPKGLEIQANNIAVIYIEPSDGQTSLYEIGVGNDGELLQPWPDKFFDQDYEERYG